MSSQTQLTAVLDIDGLLTYPTFKESVIYPLQAREIPLVFWTMGGEQRAQNILDAQQLSTASEHVISVGDYSNALQFAREGDYDLAYWCLNKNEETNQEYTQTQFVKLMDLFKRHGYGYKYPPLLGERHYLLLESDQTYYDTSEGRLTRDPSAQKYPQIAKEGGFSLILVPEYPDTWEGGNRPFSPEYVMKQVHHTLNHWSGQEIIKDVGQEIGMYQEGIRRSPEY